VEYFGLGPQDVPVLVGTLGKALGTFGAFVAGDMELVEYLIQKARSYIYTTALPPAVAAATRESLRLLEEESWRRDRLHALIRRFRAGAESLGIPLLPSATPIQPILVGDNRRAVAAGEWLLQKGFWISAIRPPTVPDGTARLRLTLSAAHEDAAVDALLAALAECPELRP
jgi:8-amino-7-oxononanoate synthase